MGEPVWLAAAATGPAHGQARRGLLALRQGLCSQMSQARFARPQRIDLPADDPADAHHDIHRRLPAPPHPDDPPGQPAGDSHQPAALVSPARRKAQRDLGADDLRSGVGLDKRTIDRQIQQARRAIGSTDAEVDDLAGTDSGGAPALAALCLPVAHRQRRIQEDGPTA